MCEINFIKGFKMDTAQPQLTHVFFVSVCHGERQHKLIKSVHSAKYSVHELRQEIRSALDGQFVVLHPPVLDDAGIMLSSTDKLPPRVRILLSAKVHESLARAGHFLDDDDDTEGFLHLDADESQHAQVAEVKASQHAQAAEVAEVKASQHAQAAEVKASQHAEVKAFRHAHSSFLKESICFKVKQKQPEWIQRILPH